MPVPCPVPLQSPWSPVGYRVVEVLDEKLPGLPAFGAGSVGRASATPSSPVGYRVLELADEKLKALPRFRRRATRPPQRSSNVGLIAGLGGPIIAAAVFVPVLLMALAGSRTSPPPTQNALRQVALGEMPQHPVFEVNIPDVAFVAADRNLPAGDAAEPIVVAAAPPAENVGGFDPDVCVPGQGVVPGRGSVGTAVDFARNPQEAGRLAKEQRKLLFLLHVSGNFEEARFT
jgi:hypothetical protein